MPEETTSINEVKTTVASDGSVKISVEKYEEMLKTISDQKSSIGDLNTRLNKALNEPPVVHRTTIVKTPEMASRDRRVTGGALMGLGASTVAVGALVYKSAR